jgi:hypothetical protein
MTSTATLLTEFAFKLPELTYTHNIKDQNPKQLYLVTKFRKKYKNILITWNIVLAKPAA